MMTTFLPKDASDPEPPSQEQLDTDLGKLMAHDPTQSYNYKGCAKT